MFLLLLSLSVSREQRIRIADSNFNRVKNLLACTVDGTGGRYVTDSSCSKFSYINNQIAGASYQGSQYGGAVHIDKLASSTIIQNNSFTSCSGNIRGGAIYIVSKVTQIYYNVFTTCYCTAGSSKVGGGAIGVSAGSANHFDQVHIKGNTYTGCYASKAGGSVCITITLNAGGWATIEDDIYSGGYLTTSSFGGVHFFMDSDIKTTISNCTFKDIVNINIFVLCNSMTLLFISV